ncbi:MAG: restriction endonuclease subunit S [Paludibacteraceae bacterium]|jgi:type I restriction enzyme S subunit|nr:restriction endonuclease subunit S [Paludibacteraceae bacterium]
MSEWKEYKLGEIAEIIPGFAFKSKEFGKIGELVIKIKDINPPYIILSAMERVDTSSYPKDKLGKYKLAKGDFVVAMTGATIGKVGKLKTDVLAYINQRVAKIKAKNCVCNDFIYYSISTEQFQAFIRNNIDSNTAQENISAISIGKFPILLPPLPEQKAIAAILSSLDDKIDLLHRQNSTLEKMAETLFRQWFIEEAKEREKTKIGLVLETVLGGTPSTKKPEYWDGTIPWINSGEVNNFRILKPTKFITELGLAESNTKLLPIGTTVLAITGATLGQISLLEISTCANQSVVGIIPNETYPKEYVFLWIKYMIDEIILNETGGAQPHINKNDVNETEILVPCNDDLEFIESKIKPLFKKISINSFQINTLIELRDSLLPKLMSGEITVNQG